MMRPIIRWASKYWFGISLFVLSFLLRWHAYNQSSFANGWDSYFYIVQIKSYLEEGSMHSSRYSLFYPVLLLLHWVVQDYELSYKIASALMVASFSLAFFNVSKILSKSSMPYLLGAYTLTSFHLTYFGAQYPKNLFGVVIFLFLLRFLLKNNYLASFLMLLANLFVHKMTAGLSIIASFLHFIFRGISKKKVSPKLVIVALVACLSMVFLIAIYFKEILDRGLGISTTPYWPITSFIHSFDGLLHIWWYFDLGMATLGLLIGFLYIIIRMGNAIEYKWVSVALILFLLSFPFLEWSVLGMSFRLFMVFVLLGPLALNMVPLTVHNKIALSTLALLIAVLGIFSIHRYNPGKYDPPYPLYKHIVQRISVLSKKANHDIELLIAHKSLAEYITYNAGIDALPWQPEYKVAPSKLWRVATGLNDKTIQYCLRNVETVYVDFLSTNYFLIREDQWTILLTNLKEIDEALYQELHNWKNPYEYRPSYLIKGK